MVAHETFTNISKYKMGHNLVENGARGIGLSLWTHILTLNTWNVKFQLNSFNSSRSEIQKLWRCHHRPDEYNSSDYSFNSIVIYIIIVIYLFFINALIN